MNIDMNYISGQLNSNIGIINLFLSFIVTGATLVYSILSWKLTNETRLMREVYTEPRVSVTVEENDVHDGFFDIIIKNIGLGPAYDVKFSVSEGHEIDGITLTEIRRLAVLNNGISYLGPNQVIKSNISYIHGNDSFFSTSFVVGTVYTSHLGKKYSEIYKIKFSEFEGIVSINESPTKDLGENIKRIADSIENLSDGRKEIRAVIETVKNKETKIKDRILTNRGYLKK